MRAPVFRLGFVVALCLTNAAWACPFCSVESQTLSEETGSADAVVLARLIKEAPPTADDSFSYDDPNAGMATFEIVEAVRGHELVAGTKEIKVVYFGEPDRAQMFLISGIGTEKIDWTTPLPLSSAGVDYVRKLASIPASGADRLEFFQQYFEHPDALLAQDAYDEFARAPYSDIQALAPRMPHDKLVHWISDPQISPSRRRLYLTMLSACGTPADVPMLESMIASDFQAMKPHLERAVQTAMAMGAPLATLAWVDIIDQDERRKKLGLDALVACYLTLGGPAGLERIEERFLKNPHTEFTYVYSTIMALRFHGEEPTSNIPRERLLASMRLLLDNPDFADQVIPDLARWEDWSVLDRLVEMFKGSEKGGYVRQPVVTYLTVASEQPGDVGARAQAALADLEKLDPEGVKLAQRLAAFGALGRARAASETSNAARPAAAPGDDVVDDDVEEDDASPIAAEEVADEGDALAASTAESEDVELKGDDGADTTNAREIADPAEYVEKPQSGESSFAAVAAASTSADNPGETSGPQATGATGANAPRGTQAAQQSAAEKVTVNKPATADDPPAPLEWDVNHRLLVIGLPLGAALLLMAIYWAILRAGAV
jgi:hypothetical protein